MVRYADDFIVLARSRHILEQYVLGSITKFLDDRGLTLSPEKTKIFTLADQTTKLNFLGYCFKYQQEWKHSAGFVKRHIADAGIALFPNKLKVIEVIDKIRTIYRKSYNLNAYSLIAKVNPIIRGWSNYYNIANSSRFRDYLRQALYHFTWNRARKKHPRWGKKTIAKNYFLRVSDENTPFRFKGALWTFHGKTRAISHYHDNAKIIYLQNPGSSTAILGGFNYCIPNKWIHIHGFHEEFMKIRDFNLKNAILSQGKLATLKEKLFKRSNICAVCNQDITLQQIANQVVHIHHIVPVYKKGSKSDVNNMQLLHSWCHRTKHEKQ